MLKSLALTALSFFVLATLSPVMAEDAAAPAAVVKPEIGKPAPEFTGTDTDGNEIKLSNYKDKIVVLEWTNPECPFVKKHYDSGNMQKLQKELTATDVVWLSINSSAEGKQGYQTGEEANKYMQEKDSSATARILDPTGAIGNLYGAKTTPHMFVIDATGKLAYEGAIDDNDSTNPADAEKAKNYVREAVKSLVLGGVVETPQTKPYGCAVKYAD